MALLPYAAMSSRSRLVRRALLVGLVLVIAGGFAMIVHPAGRSALIDGIAWLRSAGAVGQVAAIGFVVVGIPLGLPTLWFAAIIGYLFGLAVGVPLAIATIPLGATAAFLVTRWLLYDEVRALLDRRPALRVTVDAVGDGGWRLVALLRIAGPHNLLNAVLAASPLTTRGFIAGTAIGGAPSLALASSGGALAPNAEALWQAGKSFGPIGIGLLVVGVAAFVFAIVLVRRSAKRALARVTGSVQAVE